jgi:general secretion pathway protein G
MACGARNFLEAHGRRSRKCTCGRKRTAPGQNVRSFGFTLLELMIVISIMMILIAVAVPAYHRHVIQAREAVLRQNVQQLDKLIQEYTEDKEKAPQSLDDLVTAGYLHEIPKDPITGQADWECVPEDPLQAADPQEPGIIACHSKANGNFTSGEPYSSI